jgi:hypothetical protein
MHLDLWMSGNRTLSGMTQAALFMLSGVS